MVTGNSLKDRMARRHDDAQSGNTQTVQAMLSEAQELLIYSGDFFKAIEDGDTLGIAWLRDVMGYPRDHAVKEWYAKPWGDWRATIGALAGAETAGAAREILETFEMFEENPILALTLGAAITDIARPARLIYSPNQFDEYLFGLVHSGLAVKHPEKPAGRRFFEWRGAYYIPNGAIKKALISWGFVTRALGRARRQDEEFAKILPKIQPLFEQGTLDSNPEEQNLHRLVHQVRFGTVVIWDPNSRSYDREKKQRVPAGLLAILVDRPEGAANLVIREVVADHPLAANLNDREFPLLVSETPIGDSIVTLPQEVERLPRDKRDAVMRIHHLIQYCLAQEGRFRLPMLEAGPATETEGPRDKIDSLRQAVAAVEVLQMPEITDVSDGANKAAVTPPEAVVEEADVEVEAPPVISFQAEAPSVAEAAPLMVVQQSPGPPTGPELEQTVADRGFLTDAIRVPTRDEEAALADEPRTRRVRTPRNPKAKTAPKGRARE